MNLGIQRLVTEVLTVSDLERAVHEYGAGLGLDLHVRNHHGDDPLRYGAAAALDFGGYRASSLVLGLNKLVRP